MTERSDDSVSQDRIPNLIKIGEIPSSYGQVLQTDIIDPVTFTQARCRFTMNRVAGFLHSDSKITLGVVPVGNGAAFYPVNIGIASLIKSATLRIGSQTVCTTEDFGQFHAYQSLFTSNEDNKEREQYLSQRLMNHGMVYDSGDPSASVAGTPVPGSATSAPKYGLDTGRNATVDRTNGSGNTFVFPFQNHDAGSAQTISEAPVYSIYLSDLFSFLKTNQLPAFMIEQEIHIDLEFVDATTSLGGSVQSQRMCVRQGQAAPEAVYTINELECKLVYDSISYDGEVMRQFAEQNQEISFQYVDYRLAKRTGVVDVGTTTDAFGSLTFPIGGNGRLVSKVFFGLQDDTNFVAQSLLNGYVSKSADRTVGSGKTTINLRYNDRYEFSSDRSNEALLFHTTQTGEGMVPMVSKDEYGDPAVTNLTADTFEGHAQSGEADGLGRNFNWIAIRPNRAERINNKGMDLEFDKDLADGTYTLRCYLELLKVATISGGQFSCYFA
tara:strand:- start:841 stop:2328 length:1488 start_codon:yes stop_codon:yes gene_type:complete